MSDSGYKIGDKLRGKNTGADYTVIGRINDNWQVVRDGNAVNQFTHTTEELDEFFGRVTPAHKFKVGDRVRSKVSSCLYILDGPNDSLWDCRRIGDASITATLHESNMELVSTPLADQQPTAVAEPVSETERFFADLGKLVHEKSQSYGDSIRTSAKILEILYPNGVQPHQFRDMLLTARVLDKLGRIANKKDAFGDSAWLDVGGYGGRGAMCDAEDAKASGK